MSAAAGPDSPDSSDSLDPARLSAGDDWSWMLSGLDVRDSVGSTNDVCRAAADAGRPDGWTVIAEGQHAGRGRRGAVWASPAGAGVWTSVLLRPQPGEDPETLGRRLPVISAVAASDAVDEVCGAGTAVIKWPNDVLHDDRKLAGVLCEGGRGPDGPWYVAGIGINVRLSPEHRGDLPDHAGCLADVTGDPAPGREAVARALWRALDRRRVQAASDEGRAVLEADYRARQAWIGRSVRVTVAGRTLAGRMEEVTGEGDLVLALAEGGRRRVRGEHAADLRPL